MQQTNIHRICGIDEAGRGALAGPLVSAAVVITKKHEQLIARSSLKIRDGKLLKREQRNKIYKFLQKQKVEMSPEVFSTRKINNRGIGRANRETIRKLIKNTNADEYIVDGKLKLGHIKNKTQLVRCIVDADATHLPTILAGIVAKVERDKLMHGLDQLFPLYGWKANCGYGTKIHQQALLKYGTCR